MKTELWTDLEGTIIPHWNERHIHINIDKLTDLVTRYTVDHIGVFSYVLWNVENLEELKTTKIVELLGSLADGVVPLPTTHEMHDRVLDIHMHRSQNDHNQFPSSYLIWEFPKELAFIAFVRSELVQGSETKRFILFDDTAPHGLKYMIGDVEVIFENPNG